MRPERRLKPGMDGGPKAAVLARPPLHLRNAEFLSSVWGPPQPLLSSVTDPNGNVWKIGRDNLGRVTSATDPVGNARAYTFDARSRVSSITSPSDSVKLAYDPAGNLSQAQYSDGVSFNYTYDDDNRLTGGNGFSLAYDAAGRLTGSNGLVIARDAVGRMSSLTYAPGKTVSYTYDSRGLLSGVADWAGGYVNFTFDDAHQLVSLARSNGVGTAYAYDPDSRLATISDTDGGGNTLASIALTRDAIGRVTAASRNVPQEAAPPAAGAVSLSYDAASQIAGATYDGHGRLTSDNAGGTYKWSANSRLLSYSRPDGTASFTYDGRSQRISRTGADGSTVNYILNYATRLPSVATVQSGGADVRYYVYTPGGSLLYSIDAASGARRFYSFDDTGTTTFLTDDSGAITDSYGISPYGDTVTAGPNNSADNPFVWQGQLGVMQEKGTSLYYARFRYYDAAGTRFLSRDPVFSAAPKEINAYQYAAGNPVANGDPMGLRKDASGQLRAVLDADGLPAFFPWPNKPKPTGLKIDEAPATFIYWVPSSRQSSLWFTPVTSDPLELRPRDFSDSPSAGDSAAIKLAIRRFHPSIFKALLIGAFENLAGYVVP